MFQFAASLVHIVLDFIHFCKMITVQCFLLGGAGNLWASVKAVRNELLHLETPLECIFCFVVHII